MAQQLTMPKLGMDMTAGTILKWCKAEGDRVAKGEPVLEVQTDKVNMEVESPADGVLLKILFPEGETVPINSVIAVIGAAGESLPAEEEKGDRIFITPKARKLAAKHGLNIADIPGTGPNGRITEQDVRRYMNASPSVSKTGDEGNDVTVAAVGQPVPEAAQQVKRGKLIPFQGIRKVIAERMVQSLTTAAQANHRMDVDMSRMMQLRDEVNGVYQNQGVKVSVTDIIVKIVTKALCEYPIVNATLTAEGIVLLEDINIGLAVATDDGLIVPVISATPGKDLPQIATESRQLIERARSGKLRPEELKGSTFTVTNLGMYDVDSFTAIINPPESAILAVGKINEKPVVENRCVVIKPVATLSLTYDHRVIDGAPAAIFLQRVKKMMENPYLLL